MPNPNLARVTRAYVSGYDRSRTVVGSVRRQEKRTVTADFKAVLPTGETIASVTWRCTSPWVIFMSAPTISGKEVTVDADFQLGGWCHLKATITTDTGSKYSQLFEYTVRDCPLFPDEQSPATTGPYSITETA